jgi:hypothetical protein
MGSTDAKAGKSSTEVLAKILPFNLCNPLHFSPTFEAFMHSLNSIAGIRKYRIQDEIPDGFGCGMTGISPKSVGATKKNQRELDKETAGSMSIACTSLARIASRIFSRLR